MPSDNGAGVRILMGKRKITTKDWIELIKFRVALIKPFLDKITLQPLGDMRTDVFGPRKLYEFDMANEQEMLPHLHNQGFYKLISVSNIKGGVVCNTDLVFLGLSRQAHLVDIRIEVEWSRQRYIIKKLLIKRLDITECWFDEVLLTPSFLFLHLGAFFEEAMKERERLYKEMKAIHEIMEFEKNLMPFVSC